ncbi:uncharacterized protein LOC132730032 [Ruditapes philippinarum]|uniref:uncharacterized protein LOC132730032 n=1 Tax=Ruditapes philippinarum TaxID=129788 RepID=UPI00295B661A|nr:uncharacterized protein LOC132730032 [Ruditapes philippinarum]
MNHFGNIVLLLSLTTCLTSARTLQDVIAQVISETDVDGNGIISEAEFNQELLARWDTDVPSDNMVSKADFVSQWTTRYGDNVADASAFFDKLDQFFLPAGTLNDLDLFFHMATLDPDGDHQVSTADFANFIKVNHPCGGAGHLHC